MLQQKKCNGDVITALEMQKRKLIRSSPGTWELPLGMAGQHAGRLATSRLSRVVSWISVAGWALAAHQWAVAGASVGRRDCSWSYSVLYRVRGSVGVGQASLNMRLEEHYPEQAQLLPPAANSICLVSLSNLPSAQASSWNNQTEEASRGQHGSDNRLCSPKDMEDEQSRKL